MIKNIRKVNLEKSNFVKPFRLNYEQNGVEKVWDCIEVHNSVSCLLYHEEKEAFVFVKQFRPAVWFTQEQRGQKYKEQGFTYELCAGILDKNLSLEETMREEIIEELGYKVDKIKKLTSYYDGLGFSGNQQTIFYAKIKESMRISKGGGTPDEFIESVFIPKSEIMSFIFNEEYAKSTGLMFSVTWFLAFCEDN